MTVFAKVAVPLRTNLSELATEPSSIPRDAVPLPAPRSRPVTVKARPLALKRLRFAPPETTKLGAYLKAVRGPAKFKVPALTVVKPLYSRDAPLLTVIVPVPALVSDNVPAPLLRNEKVLKTGALAVIEPTLTAWSLRPKVTVRAAEELASMIELPAVVAVSPLKFCW